MPTGDLFPSVEQRLKAYHELNSRAKELVKKKAPPKPTISITREFGCEAFPIAEELVVITSYSIHYTKLYDLEQPFRLHLLNDGIYKFDQALPAVVIADRSFGQGRPDDFGRLGLRNNFV